MGGYIDSLRLISVGLMIAGATSYLLTLIGISAMPATVACVIVFCIWAVYAHHDPSVPARQWYVALGTPSVPNSSTDDVRKLLRIGTTDQLRNARQPVLDGVGHLENWVRRNLQWSAGNALIVAINVLWLLQHQLAPGSVWPIATMAFGLAVQVTTQLWFLHRARFVRRVCGATS